MSPESLDYFGAAERALSRARRITAAGVYDTAAREAYIAALNAARGVIFDKTGNATKTHSGVRTQFHKLVHEGLAFDVTLVGFLREGFDVKQVVDYETVPANIDKALAEDFIGRATAFVASARAALASGK